MRLPPSMDDTLLKNFNSKIKLAPLMLLFNGYWMLSNEQIFNNKWSYIQDKSNSMKSGHLVGFRLCSASPMFMLAIFAFFIYVA